MIRDRRNNESNKKTCLVQLDVLKKFAEIVGKKLVNIM